jgi:hypothetical protein
MFGSAYKFLRAWEVKQLDKAEIVARKESGARL